MTECEIVKKRNVKIEEFLKNGPLEIDSLQSYYPTLHTLKKIPYSKWNTITLNKTLVDIVDINENIGIISYKNNDKEEIPFFMKCTPILDTTSMIQGDYIETHISTWLPTKNHRHENTALKIQNPQNTAYIDSLCSIILGRLSEENVCPHFGSVYGVYNGIFSEYNEDITQEYSAYKREEWFKNAVIKNKLSLDIEKQELEKTEFEEIALESMGNDEDLLSVSTTESNDPTVSATYPKLPVQIVLMEKFECTFDELISCEIENTISILYESSIVKRYLIYLRKKLITKKMSSWIFQICFALTYVNDKYDFVHNDLHIQNIMGKKTDIPFLYYKIDENIFKVPTHGYIMKIIDFGRSTFTYKDNIYFGDVFEKKNEAGGQYTYPYEDDSWSDVSSTSSEFDEYIRHDRVTKEEVNPTPCFDLARFACSILEDYEDKWSDLSSFPLGRLLYQWCTDDNDRNLLELNGFGLYKHISRFVSHTNPRDQLSHEIFTEFLIETNEIDDSSQIYSLPTKN